MSAHHCLNDPVICAAAAGANCPKCLQYLHEIAGCPWDARTCREAARCRRGTACLKYAHEHGCEWDESVSISMHAQFNCTADFLYIFIDTIIRIITGECGGTGQPWESAVLCGEWLPHVCEHYGAVQLLRRQIVHLIAIVCSGSPRIYISAFVVQIRRVSC